MAKKLVYASGSETLPDQDAVPELALVGADPKC